ncbi:MAG: hypothetical protein ABR987_22255 [Terracidiphilus sp.]
MNKTSRALALTILVVLAGARLRATNHQDDLALKIPPGWKVGNAQEDRRAQTQIMELINEGDDIHNWKELLTEISGPTPHSIRKPEDFLDDLKVQREKECPGATVWNVIGKDGSSITYEWHAQPCLGWPEQVEIAKILIGKKTFYILQYAKKVKELSPDERDTWLKWLGDVQFTNQH